MEFVFIYISECLIYCIMHMLCIVFDNVVCSMSSAEAHAAGFTKIHVRSYGINLLQP